MTLKTANEILTRYADSSPWGNHCRAVAKIAGALADALIDKAPVDTDFVRRGALLHDVGRSKTHHPIRHGVEGYHLLIQLGHPREAIICASHILFGLNAATTVEFGLPEKDFFPQTIEEKLVTLADFLVQHDRATTLENRFAVLRKKNADNRFFLQHLDRAENRSREFHAELQSRFNIHAEQLAKNVLPSLK